VDDPSLPPKILITTSPKASKRTYDFCDELVGIFPGGEFIRRKKGKGFEMGRIAGWAADRGYKHLCVVNEDMKKPSKHFLCLCNSPLLTPLFRCDNFGPPS
jgi:ribosome production factor 1